MECAAAGARLLSGLPIRLAGRVAAFVLVGVAVPAASPFLMSTLLPRRQIEAEARADPSAPLRLSSRRYANVWPAIFLVVLVTAFGLLETMIALGLMVGSVGAGALLNNFGNQWHFVVAVCVLVSMRFFDVPN
ncbi:hypothetical protein [Amycolatopsis panacis]|uniref:Uncharacterized protein n=1 Tax=Amycolatopsis panacis TaxID=2340917 RepID=A0A419HWD0_9PSEU|nr:hypothetical protein [Amycolatopsis panacis]RJQ81297.1 hypothetical protein D5S19_23200 [Amycolatopsis panacis]